MNNKKQLFTFAELIVVISILGLLAILITTTLQAKREGAKRIHCKKRLHIIGMAFRLYADNNYDRLPVGDNEQGLNFLKECYGFEHNNSKTDSTLLFCSESLL